MAITPWILAKRLLHHLDPAAVCSAALLEQRRNHHDRHLRRLVVDYGLLITRRGGTCWRQARTVGPYAVLFTFLTR